MSHEDMLAQIAEYQKALAEANQTLSNLRDAKVKLEYSERKVKRATERALRAEKERDALAKDLRLVQSLLHPLAEVVGLEFLE